MGEDMKRRFLQTLITTFVMSSLIVTPVLATPQDDVKSLEQKKSQAEAQANNVNNELVGLLVDYDALQKDMQTQEKRIDDAEIDLKDAEAKEKQQYEDMKLRIKYMYEEGNAGLLSTLIRAESYADLVSKAEYVQKVHDYDRKMLDKYVETKNEVVELKGNLEEGQAEMQALSDEMVVQKENLETTLTQMRSQIEDFDSQLVQAKEAAAEELRRIEAEQRAAEEAEAAAREQQEAEEAAAAEQQAEDDSQQKEDSETEDNQVNPEPSDTSDDKKDEDKKEESNPKPSKPSENDKDKEDSKDDAKDEDDDEKQDDKTDDVPAAKPGNAALGQQIADMGCNYIGNKYVYGGTSLTNGIDCSGFVQQIHKKFGISTPRTSGAIRSGGKSVSYADRMPGDVICYSGHVGIYIGNNKIVHASNSAPYPKGGIKITSPANYRTVLAVRRYW
ncbi:MAG: hypothetical protein HFH00_10540 [Dorea sp.]|nr:hypothetical protein [Dorea sp.]